MIALPMAMRRRRVMRGRGEARWGTRP